MFLLKEHEISSEIFYRERSFSYHYLVCSLRRVMLKSMPMTTHLLELGIISNRPFPGARHSVNKRTEKVYEFEEKRRIYYIIMT
jgi:hypothetical protein